LVLVDRDRRFAVDVIEPRAGRLLLPDLRLADLVSEEGVGEQRVRAELGVEELEPPRRA
jgi:hypothetical protein